MHKLKVKHSGIIELQNFNDFPDGNLTIGEGKKSVPFAIKRFYFINNLYNERSVRGKHAHKKQEQYMFCLSGSFTLELDDGTTKQRLRMTKSNKGIRLGALLWHTMRNFSSDCIILVIADDYYKKSDYIRDYDEFLAYIKRQKKKK